MNNFRLAALTDQKSSSNPTALLSNLQYSAAWLGDWWSFVGPVQANHIFMQVNSVKDLNILQNLQAKFPKDRLIVATSSPMQFKDIKWCLRFSNILPCPSIVSIVDLLAQIYEEATGIASKPPTMQFSPEASLAGIITKARAEKTRIRCAFEGVSIIIAPEENAFYLTQSFEKLIPLLAASTENIDIQVLTEQQFADEKRKWEFGSRLSAYAELHERMNLEEVGLNEDVKQNLDDLIWFSTLIASKGKPLAKLSLTAKLRLVERPVVLSRNQFIFDYQQLVGQFSAGSASPLEAKAITRRSLFDVVNFCNACLAVGALKTEV